MFCFSVNLETMDISPHIVWFLLLVVIQFLTLVQNSVPS